MNVMRSLVAGGYFELLTCADRHYMRAIHAPFLIECRGRGGFLGGITCTETLGDIQDNVLQSLIFPDHHSFHLGWIICMSLGTIRVFRHVDAPHVGRRAG